MEVIILTIEETIIYVNEKLKEGYSIAKVERELKFGKDTLRKKLNRANYKYNKTLNQFILDVNTNITQDITYTEKEIIVNQKSNKIENKTDVNITEKDVITNPITQKNFSKNKDSALENNISNSITQSITHTEKASITQNDNTNITQSSPRTFTDEDFNILFELIEAYKSKKKPIVIPKDDSEITTRSFRSYKSVFDSFSEYCKTNNLNQKDAIAEALLTYISS